MEIIQDWIEPIWAWIRDNASEWVAHAVAIITLFFAVAAFRVAKKSMTHSEHSDRSSKRLLARERLSGAEKSFISLQQECRAAREMWDRHLTGNLPFLSPMNPLSVNESREIRRVTEVERNGRQLLEPLRQGEKKVDEMHPDDLEKFSASAEKAALEIERLKSLLEFPKPAQRF